MKTITILLVAITLYACNNSGKAELTKIPVKGAPEDTRTVAISPDTTSVLSIDEEAQIKADSLGRIKEKFPYMAKYSFVQYKVPMYRGILAKPDFKGNPYADDPEYVNFITEGCKRGINFGGHYTLIEHGCGMMCEQLFMVDRYTGKIFTGTLGLKAVDGYYGFRYEKDSNLLIANSTVLTDASNDDLGLKPELFNWKNNRFRKLP